MTKYELEQILKKSGFEKRSGGKHDIWIKRGNAPITVPRHKGDIPKGTLHSILKAAGIKR
jgi:predicted RNA binding protein YcfA (HicA-like mRNA interferase family)